MKTIPTLFALALILASLSFSLLPAHADEAAKKAIELGKAKYAICGACHGMTGNGELAPGIQMAPSFLDSKLVKADPEVSAYLLFKGIVKEDPTAYMGQMMLALGDPMPDEDVAGLISYVRSEFGKVENPAVTAEQVAAWRAKYKDAAQPTRKQLEELAEKLATEGDAGEDAPEDAAEEKSE